MATLDPTVHTHPYVSNVTKITFSPLVSDDLSAKCGVCQGAHPANYKGCIIYKQINYPETQ